MFVYFLVLLMCFCLSTPAYAGFVNGSFETGNYQGWSTIGATSIETSATFGIDPTDGNFQALVQNHDPGSSGISVSNLESFLNMTSGSLNALGNGTVTQGSAIQQTFTAKKGDQISFDWDFLSNSDVPDNLNNDFAFVRINPLTTSTLANTLSAFDGDSTLAFVNSTGYQTTTVILPSDGVYTIQFGVVDVRNTLVNSGLLIDNLVLNTSSVPEPTSMIPFGFGMVTLAGYSIYRGKCGQ